MFVHSRLLGRLVRAAPPAGDAPAPPARDPLFTADSIRPDAAGPEPAPPDVSPPPGPGPAGETGPPRPAVRPAPPVEPYRPSFLFAAGLIPGSAPPPVPMARPPLRRRPVSTRPPAAIPFRRATDPPVSHPFP